MGNSQPKTTWPHVDSSTTKYSLVELYVQGQRRKGLLTAVALAANIVMIVASLGVLAAIIFYVFRWGSGPLWVAGVGISLAVVALVSSRVDHFCHRHLERTSGELLRTERRLWKHGSRDYTGEHLARFNQPFRRPPGLRISAPKSPSALDIASADRKIQSTLDLVVAPFGSVAQVRADARGVAEGRLRVAASLGVGGSTSYRPGLEFGLVAASSYDSVNSNTNVSVLTQARLWQDADPERRMLIYSPTFRPSSFAPWHENNLNRIGVYLPQFGLAPTLEEQASQVSLLLSEQPVDRLHVFGHRRDTETLDRLLLQRGVAASTRFGFIPERSGERGAIGWLRREFFRFDSPQVQSPLTFDVGCFTGAATVMEGYFAETQSDVVSALERVSDIQMIEQYGYSAERHEVSVGLRSWRSSKALRHDLLWTIFQGFSAFYRADGDWKRAGSPTISLVVDDIKASRSGAFMEYLAIARQTRQLMNG